MKELSATDAARRFSEVLDAVEHDGESFVIRRKGKPVARLEPARANGTAVRKLLRRIPNDPDWAREVRELRRGLPVQERDWPD
ncbi:MAG: type II toxin-antitoxin system Phd/YefM family antitoxin [Actinomycetota bacterium]